MKYAFNSTLLKSIFDLLQTTPYKMGQRIISCSHDTLKRNIKNGDIRFDTFVEICNEYHLNIFAFFYPIKETPDNSHPILSDDEFREITFRPDIIDNYQNKEDKMWCSDVADWMSRSKKKVHLPVTFEDNKEVEPAQEEVTKQTTYVPAANLKRQNWKFNLMLLAALPSVIGVKKVDIGLSIGRQVNTYTYAMQRKDFRMRSLVELCNRYHVDIMLFFVKQEYLPMNILIDDNTWKPIVFHPERLMDFCIDDTQKALLEKLDYTLQRLQRNTCPETTPMQATDFVDICNRLGVEPGYFFDAPTHVSDQRVAKKLNDKIATQEEKIDQLMIEKRRLESQLRHLQAMQQFGK